MKFSREKKSVLVIGMGRFGMRLAEKMQELGNSVMVVDESEKLSSGISALFEDYMIGDCTDKNFIGALGVRNFDICFVTVSENFESSVIITAMLKSLGAKYIITKATREIQAEVLKKVGADEVVDPLWQLAEKLAIRYDMNRIFDFIGLTNEYAIYEIAVPADWVGHSICELDIGRKCKLNVLVVKNDSVVKPMPEKEYKFKKEDNVVVMGKAEDVFRLKD